MKWLYRAEMPAEEDDDLPCAFCKTRDSEVLVVLTDRAGVRQEFDSCLECPDERVEGWRAFGYEVTIYGVELGDV